MNYQFLCIAFIIGCSVSQDSSVLACGTQCGKVIFFSLPDLIYQPQLTIKNDQKVSCIKYSPNNSLLAISIAPPKSQIQIYDVNKSYTLKEQLSGVPSLITHFDFSEDSMIIQVASQDNQLNYFSTSPAKLITSQFQSLKDEKFFTYTLPLGYPVQNIY